jgi:hypothetical protein
MRPKRPLTRVLATLVGLALCAGCGFSVAPPEEPVLTALLLFETATVDQPDEARLERLFELSDDELFRARLLDALEALPDSGAPEVRQVERFDTLGRAAVDVTFALSGGSEADYSVQLKRVDESNWRVIAFHGPGISWPTRRRPRGDGLSTRPDP